MLCRCKHINNAVLLYDTSWIVGEHYSNEGTNKPTSHTKKNQSKRTNIRKDTTKTNQSGMLSQYHLCTPDSEDDLIAYGIPQ